MRTDDRRALGAGGEAAVADWYRGRGFTVEAMNWRCRTGEIDLIARRGALLVFCEVKTRRSVRLGAPEESVTRAKQLRIRRLAAQWLREHAPIAPAANVVRFDVAGVLDRRIEVIEGAF